MALIPSENLCAHVHDAVNNIVDFNHKLIDPFVTTIYKSDRVIPVCKEIAYLCKSVLAQSEIDVHELHHIPVRKDKDGVPITDNQGIPLIKGSGFQLIYSLLIQPVSDERDRALILMTKLAQLVKPLQAHEGARSCVSMIKNIETPIIPKFEFEEFREFIRPLLYESKVVKSFDWHNSTRSLHEMCEESTSSTKKKPSVSIKYKTQEPYWDNEAETNKLSSYDLLDILTSKQMRELYEFDKETFLTLTTGRPVVQVVDDSLYYQRETISTPVGRLGIRLQEGEKVRTLWMPHPVFASLLNPMVNLVESLVKDSPYQTAYIDDSIAANDIRRVFFGNEEESDDLLFSIDQSNYTDNFPYKLQRIIIEELVDMKVLPTIILPTLDLLVKGGYLPSRPFRKVWTSEVHFANGTPMGGDGLWMLSTLTHEFLILYLQDIIGLATPFRVQGDDAILKGRTLFALYRETLGDLGCSINMSKTMVSTRAVEYCGFISTPTQSVPMFRPHDRLTQSLRDLASDRAIQAYGMDNVLSWVLENRPHDLIYLQVAGLVPILEDDEMYSVVINAQTITQALKSRTHVLDCGESREQQSRYYSMRGSWPVFIEDEESLQISHDKRSSYEVLTQRLRTLQVLYETLIRNSDADLVSISNQIIDLCSVIIDEHSDFIRPELHLIKEKSRGRMSSRPGKSKTTDDTMKQISKSLGILGHEPQKDR